MQTTQQYRVFVMIAFPGTDGRYLSRLDLLKRFPELQAQIATRLPAVEVVARPAAKLRAGVKAASTSSAQNGSA
jgi:hypothetical protein